jgi:hypothetical protein
MFLFLINQILILWIKLYTMKTFFLKVFTESFTINNNAIIKILNIY